MEAGYVCPSPTPCKKRGGGIVQRYMSGEGPDPDAARLIDVRRLMNEGVVVSAFVIGLSSVLYGGRHSD